MLLYTTAILETLINPPFLLTICVIPIHKWEAGVRVEQGASCRVAQSHVPLNLFDLFSTRRPHFDHSSQTGVLLHMMSGVGVRAIGDSPDEAQAL